MEEKKITFGQQFTDNVINKEQEINELIDVQRTLQKKYIDRLVGSVDQFKKIHPDHQKDFFIEVITKPERLFRNYPRTYFVGRKTCPTPFYDQSVYRYNWKDDNIEYLWSLPDLDNANYLASHCLTVPEELKQLMGFVMDYYNGDLFKRCKQLNGEQLGSNLLENKEVVTDSQALDIKKYIEKEMQ